MHKMLVDVSTGKVVNISKLEESDTINEASCARQAKTSDRMMSGL